MRLLCAAAIATLAAGCERPAPKPIQPSMVEVSFAETHSPPTVSHAGVTVALELRSSNDDEKRVVATIEVPGFDTFTREVEATSADYGRYVGIGLIAESDAAPSVILTSYTGGAHCCTVIQVVRPINGKLTLIDVDTWDGDVPDTFPTDEDDDGTVDFVTSDPAFNYQFSSYAGSFGPPKIINIVGDQSVDVSAKPAFRDLYEDFSRRARGACVDPYNHEPAGACAGYVASEVRLGRGDEAMRFVMSRDLSPTMGAWPDACNVPLKEGPCPAAQTRSFHSFGAALAWFLGENGYLRPQS